MKEEIKFDADGDKIVFLVPGTDKVKELERRINAGEVNKRDSFADDPSTWDGDDRGVKLMVSIQTISGKENTMQRFFVLLLAVALLTVAACHTGHTRTNAVPDA